MDAPLDKHSGLPENTAVYILERETSLSWDRRRICYTLSYILSAFVSVGVHARYVAW